MTSFKHEKYLTGKDKIQALFRLFYRLIEIHNTGLGETLYPPRKIKEDLSLDIKIQAFLSL